MVLGIFFVKTTKHHLVSMLHISRIQRSTSLNLLLYMWQNIRLNKIYRAGREENGLLYYIVFMKFRVKYDLWGSKKLHYIFFIFYMTISRFKMSIKGNKSTECLEKIKHMRETFHKTTHSLSDYIFNISIFEIVNTLWNSILIII